MFFIKVNNFECFRLLLLFSFFCFANARQIRYNRYNTEVIRSNVGNRNSSYTETNETEDGVTEVEAIVREIKLAPYPANETTAGSIQGDIMTPVTDESTTTSTTETTDFPTTIKEYKSEVNNNNENDIQPMENTYAESNKTNAPYPPAGFQPKIPFLLPAVINLYGAQQQEKENHLTGTSNETELKAAYTVPSSALLIPASKLQLKKETGSDSESVKINTKTQKRSQSQQRSLIPIRLTAAPLLLTQPVISESPVL